MEAYRYCVQCGAKMDYPSWFRANYCSRCGTELRKEPYVWSKQSGPSKGGGGVFEVVPASAVRQLQAAGKVLKKHSGSCSAIAIGAGTAGLVLAPLVLAAGQTIMILGGIIVVASGLVSSGNDEELGAGAKMGLGLLGLGALVYGSSYVLMVAGGVSIATGIGGGVYSGAKAISKAVKSKIRTVNGQLLLEGKHEQ